MQVAQGEVGQVVGALVRADQVGRERGVLGDPDERPAVGCERQRRTLGVVQHLGSLRIREPRGERRIVCLAHRLDVEVGRPTVGQREGDAEHPAGAAPPGAAHVDAHPFGAEPLEPRRQGVGGQDRAVELEPAFDFWLRLGSQHVHDPGAQLAAELQLVEQRHRCRPVPLAQPHVTGQHLEVEVADQRVESAVADHVAEVLAQRLALLAGDLVGVGDHVVESVVLVDPLGREPDTHSRNAGQVVGGLPHQRRDLGIAPRRHAVLVLHRLWGHPGQVGHAAHRVEHGRPLADQLEGVAVAAHDQHVHVVGHRLGDQGADDVVGLEARLLQERDVQRVEERFDQRELTAELVGCLVALRFVFGVLLRSGTSCVIRRTRRPRGSAARRGARW